MKIVSIQNVEHYLWGEGCDGWHLLKYENVSIIQERVPAQKSEIKHYHQVSRQFFYILEGKAVMKIGKQNFVLKNGEGIEIPPNTPHQFCNESNKDVSFIVVSVPKSHGDRINLE